MPPMSPKLKCPKCGCMFKFKTRDGKYYCQRCKGVYEPSNATSDGD